MVCLFISLFCSKQVLSTLCSLQFPIDNYIITYSWRQEYVLFWYYFIVKEQYCQICNKTDSTHNSPSGQGARLWRCPRSMLVKANLNQFLMSNMCYEWCVSREKCTTIPIICHFTCGSQTHICITQFVASSYCHLFTRFIVSRFVCSLHEYYITDIHVLFICY